jgi:hypothetical protein
MRKVSYPYRKLRETTATYPATLAILKTTNTETTSALITPNNALIWCCKKRANGLFLGGIIGETLK